MISFILSPTMQEGWRQVFSIILTIGGEVDGFWQVGNQDISR
jgi:hypothetical protein